VGDRVQLRSACVASWIPCARRRAARAWRRGHRSSHASPRHSSSRVSPSGPFLCHPEPLALFLSSRAQRGICPCASNRGIRSGRSSRRDSGCPNGEMFRQRGVNFHSRRSRARGDARELRELRPRTLRTGAEAPPMSLPARRADVREAQDVERLGLASPALPASLRCISPELNQPHHAPVPHTCSRNFTNHPRSRVSKNE
jgi:hypothetical protein